MNKLVNLLFSTIAVLVTAFLLPGVDIENFWIGIVVVVVLAALNTFVRPILVFLTLPATLLTLGLFLLVINAFIAWLAGRIVPGFLVDGFFSALAFSIVLSMIHWVLNLFQQEESQARN